MSNDKTDLNRRKLLKGLASVPAVALMGYQPIARAEMLSTSDSMAKAMQYTENSSDSAKHCSGCALYQGGDAPTGGCPVFPGKEVAATGWCTSWVKKPA